MTETEKREKPKRRFLSISLRAFFVFVFVAAAVVVAVVIPGERHYRARKWVEEHRGDFTVVGSSLISDGRSMWLSEKLGCDVFLRIKTLGLDADEIYELKPLSGLSSLEHLFINQFIHESVDFKDLKSMKNLKRLSMTKWAGLTRAEIDQLILDLPDIKVEAEPAR